jgi:hypothetical protein
MVQLRGELGGPHDRTGHQLGEERYIEGEVDERELVDVVAACVYHVAEGLEREERDADR